MMTARVARRAALIAGLMLPASGCFFAADLINPGLISGLGLDPGTILGEPGRVIIAVNNATGSQADMFVRFSQQADASEQNFEVFGVNVAAGATINRVFTCPLTFVQSGGALVLAGDMGVAIPPGGAPLVEGAFRCGDVIVVRLIQVGTGTDAANFAIQIQVLPGR